MTQHCGYVAVVGKPNVGKSTLMNRSIGVRLSITTYKPQTTRHRILGVKTEGDYQYVFIDTPGYHLGEGKAINQYMNRMAVSTLQDVDVIVFVIQAMKWTKEEEALLNKLSQEKLPVIAVINKIDVLDTMDELLPFISEVSEKYDFEEIIPISAKKGNGVDRLENLLQKHLPEQDHIFDEDDYTDKNMRFLVSERIREQLFLVMNEELPYALTVEIEQFIVEEDRYMIGAVIWVERQSQKGIVIGKNGKVLKEIGTRARKSINNLFGTRVHLELWVRVKEGWADDVKALHSLGYTDHG